MTIKHAFRSIAFGAAVLAAATSTASAGILSR